MKKPVAAYPFVTKAQVAERLSTDRGFIIKCMTVMARRYRERATRVKGGPAWGWMASQAVVGTRLARKFEGREVTEADFARATTLLKRYTTQLADHFRSEQLHKHPELAAVAARFGVLPEGFTVPSEPLTPAPPDQPDAVDDVLDDVDIEELLPESQPSGLEVQVVEHLKAHPGQRSEEIALAIGTNTAMLAPLLRDQVEAGRLTKEGAARGTKYSVP